MNRIHATRLATLSLLFVYTLPSFAHIYSSDSVVAYYQQDSGRGYRKQPSLAGTDASISVNGTLLGSDKGLYYPHSTISSQSGPISDERFSDLLWQNLRDPNYTPNNPLWTHDSLIIHMNQCFSGGFIDEIDDYEIPRVSIDTAAWWARPSKGTTVKNAAQNNYDGTTSDYGRLWQDYLKQANAPNGSGYTYNVNQVAAYLNASFNDPNKQFEFPEYYANGADLGGQSYNSMTNCVIGASSTTGQSLAGNMKAIIFVGKDTVTTKGGGTVRALRMWTDAANYAGYLQAQGYTNDDIFFYYADGTKPPGAGNLPNGLTITGAANETNMETFFEVVARRSTGQVNVWIGDHGGLQNTFKGNVKLKPNADPKSRVTIGFNLGDNLHNYADEPLGDADLRLLAGGITGTADGEQLDIILHDSFGDTFDLGGLTFDSNPSDDSFDLMIPYADLQQIEAAERAHNDSNGDIYIDIANYDILSNGSAYAGDYSDDYINEFSVDFVVDQPVVEAPEPSSVSAMLLMLACCGCRKRYRMRASLRA